MRLALLSAADVILLRTPMELETLAAKFETLLVRIEEQERSDDEIAAPIDVDSLAAAAGGDPSKLADALWVLVRNGRGLLVGRDRKVLAKLVPGRFEAADLLALLFALTGAG